MLLGAVTYNVLKNMDLETVIRTLETTGFDAVELRTGHKHGVEPSLSEAERAQGQRALRAQQGAPAQLRHHLRVPVGRPGRARRSRSIWPSSSSDWRTIPAALGVKVRPNGLAKGVPRETTIQNIAAGLREVGEHGYVHGVEIWLEVHGAETQVPTVAAEIMRATESQERRTVLEFQPDRRGERQREGELRPAAPLAEELPHQRTDQRVSVQGIVRA